MSSTQQELCGEDKMGGIANAQVRFAQLFGSETVTQMNMVWNRLYWPLLIYFIFKEKTCAQYDGLTMADLKHSLFHNFSTKGYMRDLMLNRKPIVKKQEEMYEKTKYDLTNYGRKIATIMWNHLESLSKENGKSMEAYCANIRNTLEIEPDAKDEEEELLKRMEEDAKKAAEKAGVIKNENGDGVIDLDKVVL